MRGLSSKKSISRRSRSTCSFCRSPDHQVTACPHIKTVWQSLQKGVIPLEYFKAKGVNDPNSNSNFRWYLYGQNWGDLYRVAEKAHKSWENAQNRKNTPKQKRSAVQSCGFCKGKGHSRRNCDEITTYAALLKKANRNFRRWFYEEYVTRQGLSTGAIIEFDFLQEVWNKPPQKHVVKTIVTDVNWDTINLFAFHDWANTQTSWSTDVDGAKQEKMNNMRAFLQSPVLCKVPKTAFDRVGATVDTGYRNSTLPFYGVQVNSRNATHNHPILHNYEEQAPLRDWGHPNKVVNFKVVSRAPQTLSNDWIDGYSDELSIIFKKFTLAQLDFFGILDHIRHWADFKSS